MTVHQGWIANISDGTLIFEHPHKEHEKSAWQQLIAHCKAKAYKITGLRLQRAGITIVALSHKRCIGYYQAYEASIALYSGEYLQRQGVGSVIGDKVFITWIDNNGHVYHDVRALSSSLPHTFLFAE